MDEYDKKQKTWKSNMFLKHITPNKYLRNIEPEDILRNLKHTSIELENNNQAWTSRLLRSDLEISVEQNTQQKCQKVTEPTQQ